MPTDKTIALRTAYEAMKAARKAYREAEAAVDSAYQAAYAENEDAAYAEIGVLVDADLDELTPPPTFNPPYSIPT